jgi:hypothetical protein
MAIIALPRVGEEVRAFMIGDGDAGETYTDLTPAGIAKYIGTRCFGVAYRYLYDIPLTVFFRMEPSEDDPVAVRGESERICGPVLVLGYDGSPCGLGDFELACIKANVTMERYGEEYTVMLNEVSKKRREAPVEMGVIL